MMRVWGVWMVVARRFVVMHVAVRARGQGVVPMMVMAVVVGVCVFVLDGFMHMGVCVVFGQVQQHAEQHHQPADGQ